MSGPFSALDRVWHWLDTDPACVPLVEAATEYAGFLGFSASELAAHWTTQLDAAP